MSAGSYNMVVEQGATFSLPVSIAIALFNFTGYLARAKIRDNFSASGGTLATITCTVGTIATGVMPVTLSMTATETAAITNTVAGLRNIEVGFWDLEVYHTGTGDVKRILQGTVSLSRNATV